MSTLALDGYSTPVLTNGGYLVLLFELIKTK